jgi:hypothetical protein
MLVCITDPACDVIKAQLGSTAVAPLSAHMLPQHMRWSVVGCYVHRVCANVLAWLLVPHELASVFFWSLVPHQLGDLCQCGCCAVSGNSGTSGSSSNDFSVATALGINQRSSCLRQSHARCYGWEPHHNSSYVLDCIEVHEASSSSNLVKVSCKCAACQKPVWHQLQPQRSIRSP